MEITCDYCSQLFDKRPSLIKEGRCNYCSRECHHKSMIKKTEVFCDYCGASLFRSPCELSPKNYCDRDCHTATKNSPVELVCETCGDTFIRKQSSMRGKHNYCSRKCFAPSITGPLNWRWTDRSSKTYTVNRDTIDYKDWRFSVFERDLFTCQHCDTSGVPLNAHHLLSFTRFPDSRFIKSNGVTLCVTCHKEFHKLYTRAQFTEDDFIEFQGGVI